MASSINDNEAIPLRVPAATIAFLHRLGKHCDHSTKALGRFLILIPSSILVNEIVRTLLPAHFNTMRDELERLQREREAAVANQEWDHAIALRDRVHSLQDRLQQACHDVLEVQPDHVLQAIAT